VELRGRLAELARRPPSGRPVVSVYLNTRWTDESQRERVRIFLKNQLREARAATAGRAAGEDLDWIEAQGRRLIEQTTLPDASGVALFAGGDGLREILPVRVAFEDTFVVAEVPHLRPLATAADEIVPALVVFVDGVHARLLPLTAVGPGQETRLESAVEGRHRATGLAEMMAQDRYQRHIEEHRDQHYEAVAAAVAELAERESVERIVLSGEGRAVAILRRHLPSPLGRRVVAAVAGAAHEPMATIAARAAELLAHADEQEDAAAVDRLLDAAAKGGRAVVGVAPTLEAVNRNAVQRLYLVPAFERPGALCERCATLQPPTPDGCVACGGATRPAELGEAMVGRVLTTGGSVSVVERHAGLVEQEGVGALLRYAA
jgi:hypothetical protein